MYLSYYNLKAKPFQMSTDPEFLWLGEKHREALAVLKYAILENKGVLALTGDVGTGKTTLINALLRSLGEDTVTATIYDPRLEVLDFFNTVAAAFNIEGTFDGKGKFILKFMDFLIKTHERNQKILLIIDEAQGINEDLLEEIRLLSNLEAEYTRLLNIFFVGQNEFIDILQRYENRALRQRVTIRYHIEPLTLNETAAYIKHRLEVSGTKAPIFDSGAIDEIYFFSGGYPRLINIMCDHALLSGFVREFQVINANLIRECREELLVSKKKSENDFQYPGDDYRSLPRETMFTEPPADPYIPVEDSHSSSEPPTDPYIPVEDSHSSSEPPPDPSIPMEDDSHSYEDEQMVFSTWEPKSEREEPRKSSKKRFFRSSLTIAIFLIVGLAAGYFFYSSDMDTAESFVTFAQEKAKKYFSVKSGTENEQPSKVPTRSETSDIPGRIEAGKVGDSRFFISKSPNSKLLKEAIPKETETPQVIPSKKFPEENDAQKSPLETESLREAAPATTKPVDTVPSDLRQKAPVIAPITEKTPDKIQVPAQVLLKEESTSLNAAAALSGTENRKSETTPALKTKQSQIQTLASKPVQVHATPKTPETIKTEAIKPLEKAETGESITKPVQAQKKTSERYQTKPQVNKIKEPESSKKSLVEKKSSVASSASSKKQTGMLATVPLVSRPQKTVVSKTQQPMVRKNETKEKAQPKIPVSEVKKTENRVDRNVVSSNAPANTSRTTGNAGFSLGNLHTRLKTFLDEYCRTYEQKDLDKFSTLFTLNAVEKGKPFRSWLSKYRQNFSRIDSMNYDIELERFATQEESGLVKIDGIYHVRAKLGGSKEWRESSGQISMVLQADGNSFKVRQLDY